MRTPGELETPPEGELRARNGKGGDCGGGVAVTHSCPERTGDSGTWVLGEWATRCSGDKKGVPRAARCSRARRHGPSVIGRPASALGAGAAARSRQPVGGSRREARRAQGRPAPPVPPPGRNSPAGSWDAVTPGFGNRADTQEAHLRTRLGTGPRSGADGHRGLDSSARPPRFRQPRCDLGSLLALWLPRGSRTATATSSASPGAGSGRRSVRSSLLPAAPSEGGQRVSAPSCSLTRRGAELRGARHATVPASVGPGTSGHEPRPAGPSDRATRGGRCGEGPSAAAPSLAT